jgi:uncharacterized membrane protein
MYPPNLADSFRAQLWRIYTHAAAALFALAIGPLQFHGGPRARRLRLHRFLGRVYVVASPATGLSGIYMAAYSYGGPVTHLGFGLSFAAVTLRLLLPLLAVAHGGAFEPAYRWGSWLCRLPNLLWAEWLVRRDRPRTPSARLRPT